MRTNYACSDRVPALGLNLLAGMKAEALLHYIQLCWGKSLSTRCSYLKVEKMYTSTAVVPRATYRSRNYLFGSLSDSAEEENRSPVHNHSILPTSQLQIPSFSRSPASSPRTFHSVPDGLVLFPTNPTGLSWPVPSSSLPPGAEDFNFFSLVPPEIAVKILLYLQPEDLCQAVQVCVRWRQLAQYKTLEMRRKKYIEEKREEYQKSKENYVPSNMDQQRSFSPAMTESPGGPLSTIQPLHQPSPQLPSSPTATSFTSPSASFTSPSASRFTWADSENLLQHYQPPSPTIILLEDVKHLSLDDKNHELHCTLFSSKGIISPPPAGRRKSIPSNLSTLRNTIKEVVGKKVNKSRLRRL